MSRIARWATSSDASEHQAWGFDGRKLCRVDKYGYLYDQGKTYQYDCVENAKKAAEQRYSNQGQGKVKDIIADVKGFVHDNRNIIYWLAVAFLVDHLFFGGAFRARLNALVEKMIGRVERQLEAKT